jgi:hypothetical protein
MRRKISLTSILVIALALAACTTAGGGSDFGGRAVGIQATPIPTAQCWVLSDSRGKNLQTNSGKPGWGSYVASQMGCKNFSEGAQGFTVRGEYHQTLPDLFASLVDMYGVPAVVYVDEGVNDALRGVDASVPLSGHAESPIEEFHDLLTGLGIEQHWATSPYTAGGPTRLPGLVPFDQANALLQKINAKTLSLGAKDCAGPNPNPDTYDGVHLQTTEALAACITGVPL